MICTCALQGEMTGLSGMVVSCLSGDLVAVIVAECTVVIGILFSGYLPSVGERSDVLPAIPVVHSFKDLLRIGKSTICAADP